MTNRAKRGLIAAALLVTIAATAAPAHAAGPIKNLRCAMEVKVAFHPGISATPSDGTFSGGGPIACDAHPLSPPALVGTISLSGTMSPTDTCVEGAGSGTLTASLGTAAGEPVTLTSRFTFLRAGLTLNGPVTGTGNDAGLGNLALLLIPGPRMNCMQTPVTRVTAVGLLTLTGQIS